MVRQFLKTIKGKNFSIEEIIRYSGEGQTEKRGTHAYCFESLYLKGKNYTIRLLEDECIIARNITDLKNKIAKKFVTPDVVKWFSNEKNMYEFIEAHRQHSEEQMVVCDPKTKKCKIIPIPRNKHEEIDI